MLKKIKNTLAILLAVCFIMSVAAAAVSAAPVFGDMTKWNDQENKWDGQKKVWD